MKKYILIAAIAVMTAACCNNQKKEKQVLARTVPERADDFVFENDLIAGRFYGQALEGNPTSPGIDIWVKLPGALVANDWYNHAVNDDPDYYHHDHGGKDCYKVAVSRGGGASAPFVDGRLCYPATNYRSSEILEDTANKVVFMLHYPEWEAAEGISVKLDKKVSLESGSYFADVTDIYTFTGADSLCIAAGIKLHGAQETVQEVYSDADRYAIWEKASDQSIEPEDGMVGVAVIVPESVETVVSPELDHALLIKKVASGEPFEYSYGSCWSKGNLKNHESWFREVRNR